MKKIEKKIKAEMAKENPQPHSFEQFEKKVTWSAVSSMTAEAAEEKKNPKAIWKWLAPALTVSALLLLTLGGVGGYYLYHYLNPNYGAGDTDRKFSEGSYVLTLASQRPETLDFSSASTAEIQLEEAKSQTRGNVIFSQDSAGTKTMITFAHCSLSLADFGVLTKKDSDYVGDCQIEANTYQVTFRPLVSSKSTPFQVELTGVTVEYAGLVEFGLKQ